VDVNLSVLGAHLCQVAGRGREQGDEGCRGSESKKETDLILPERRVYAYKVRMREPTPKVEGRRRSEEGRRSAAVRPKVGEKKKGKKRGHRHL